MDLFIIMGKSGSGKDYLIKSLKEKYPDKINVVRQCTTRPKRNGEEDGVEYHFCTEKELNSVWNPDETSDVMECRLYTTEFGNWYYYTRENELVEDRINLLINTPSGANEIADYFIRKKIPININVIYIMSSSYERLKRALERIDDNLKLEEKDKHTLEICRRIRTDEQSFSDAILDEMLYYGIINNYDEKLLKDAEKFIFQ